MCRLSSKANIVGISAIPHDLRRSAITRWEALGIPQSLVMAAVGHKPQGVHERYINYSDEQLTQAFAKLMLPPAKRPTHLPRRDAA